MNLDLIVERHGYGPLWTIGTCQLGAHTWSSVEQPWNDNKVGHSCIPVGVYELKPCIFYSGDGPGGKQDYPTYEVVGVPGRSQVKIHVANWPYQLEGCIALGKTFAVDPKNILGVLHSQDAFDEWYGLMEMLRPTRLDVRDSLKVVHHNI